MKKTIIPKNKYLLNVMLITFFVCLTACTDSKPVVPYVLELKVVPTRIILKSDNFYPKPFTVRVQYSNATTKNISSTVSWVSENSALLKINPKGELVTTGKCEKIECPVFLVATDPESGKSARVTVILKFPKDTTVSKNTQSSGVKNESPAITQASIQKTAALEDSIDQIEQTAEPPDSTSEEPNNILAENSTAISDTLPTVFSTTPSSALLSSAISRTDKTFNSDNIDQANNLPDSVPKSNSEENRLNQTESSLLVAPEKILVSGERYQPDVWQQDGEGNQFSLPANQIECHIIVGSVGLMALVENCNFIAITPGDYELDIRIPALERSLIQKIRIIPIAISRAKLLNGSTFNLTALQSELWFNLSGLIVKQNYRLLINGNLADGLKLDIVPDAAPHRFICSNTKPQSLSQVACYFVAKRDMAELVINNPILGFSVGKIVLETIREDSIQSNAAGLLRNAVILERDIPHRAFIFANEFGVKNRHYYRYQISSQPAKETIIKLSGFTRVVGLNVSWSSNACVQNKQNTNGELVCIIPPQISGSVNIEINGNNHGSGLQNGPAARDGGSWYSIIVREKI